MNYTVDTVKLDTVKLDTVKISIGILALLNLVDTLYTRHFLMNGITGESNPVMAYIVLIGGVVTFVSVKVFATIFIVVTFLLTTKNLSSISFLAKGVVYFGTGLYFLVCCYHIFLFGAPL